jgi:hypothetical protein
MQLFIGIAEKTAKITLAVGAFRNEHRIRPEWKDETSHPGEMVIIPLEVSVYYFVGHFAVTCSSI